MLLTTPLSSFSETPETKLACFNLMLVALIKPSASLKPDTSTILPASISFREEKPSSEVRLSVLMDCPNTSIVTLSELI